LVAHLSERNVQAQEKKLGAKALEMHCTSLAVRKQSFTVFLESSAMSALLHMPSLAPTFIQETKRFLVALDGPGQAAPRVPITPHRNMILISLPC
jgi:hypothetical protein